MGETAYQLVQDCFHQQWLKGGFQKTARAVLFPGFSQDSSGRVERQTHRLAQENFLQTKPQTGRKDVFLCHLNQETRKKTHLISHTTQNETN